MGHKIHQNHLEIIFACDNEEQDEVHDGEGKKKKKKKKEEKKKAREKKKKKKKSNEKKKRDQKTVSVEIVKIKLINTCEIQKKTCKFELVHVFSIDSRHIELLLDTREGFFSNTRKNK